MARAPKDQSNAQESEAQRSESQTSDNGTSLVSGPSTPVQDSQISADDEQAEVQASVDKMLGNDEDADAPKEEMIKVKTKGPYLIHDPTTSDTVEEEGSNVRNSAFIQTQLDAGRIEKA